MSFSHPIFRVCLILSAAFAIAACGNKNKSIYSHLSTDEDGSIAQEIGDSDEFPEHEDNHPQLPDELSVVEQKLIKEQHGNQLSKVSFLVVNAETKKVIRSYKAQTPRRLASVTKVATAVAALENVDNVSFSKVGTMLKTSNNGEASRYVRLAAKAIDGLVVTGGEYTAAASCPSSTAKETPAARSALQWIKKQIPHIDWSNADILDGAGCNYGNFFTALQMSYILELAESYGKSYGGESFEDLLSISGVEGTWKSYNQDSKGMIFAKTGTLNPNSNLAGYFYAKRNGHMHKYYFTVFVEKSAGSANTTKARKFIEALVRNWIQVLNKGETPLNVEI